MVVEEMDLIIRAFSEDPRNNSSGSNKESNMRNTGNQMGNMESHRLGDMNDLIAGIKNDASIRHKSDDPNLLSNLLRDVNKEISRDKKHKPSKFGALGYIPGLNNILEEEGFDDMQFSKRKIRMDSDDFWLNEAVWAPPTNNLDDQDDQEVYPEQQ